MERKGYAVLVKQDRRWKIDCTRSKEKWAVEMESIIKDDSGGNAETMIIKYKIIPKGNEHDK